MRLTVTIVYDPVPPRSGREFCVEVVSEMYIYDFISKIKEEVAEELMQPGSKLYLLYDGRLLKEKHNDTVLKLGDYIKETYINKIAAYIRILSSD